MRVPTSAVVLASALLMLGVEASSRDDAKRATVPGAAPVHPPPGAGRDVQVRAAADRVARAEADHGASSEEAARALADEAYLFWTFEEYEAGRPFAERALAIRLAGPVETLDRAWSQYQAADFRRATGDFAGALDGYRDAIATWTRLLGEDHVESASAWHYMGIVRALTGDPEAAGACLRRALALRERHLGEDDPLVASTVQALAGLAARAGDPGAEGLFARAQRIWERRYGPSHPFVARSLLARARLRSDAGDLASARPFLDRALSIRIQAFGAEHYLVAQTRLARAELLARAGSTDEALAEATTAIAMLRASLGPSHPDVAAALSGQARLQWSAGHHGDALVTALAAERMARAQFLRSASDLDEGLALRYAAARTSGLDVLLTALAEKRSEPDPDKAAREAVDAIIRSRGMVLEAQGGPGQAGGVPSGPSAGGADPGLEEVRRALDSKDALVAYVRYEHLAAFGRPAIPSYLAVVLRSGSGFPRGVPLGPAAAVDAAVLAWRGAATRDPRITADGLPENDAQAERAARAAGERLRRAIWDPVAPAIEGARQVFVVPDGAIDLVAFGALPAGGDRYLVETGPLLHSLTAERDLTGMIGDRARGAGILALGGPDFDAPTAATGMAAATRGIPPAARPLCPEYADLAFRPLPGAAQEAGEVTALFPPDGGDRVVLQGADAAAGPFSLQAQGKRVLHLATHAFVLPERCAASPPVGAGADPDLVPAERLLLRAGLAFAGANSKAARGGAGDGVLTAEEIASLDLSGVDWVVLSACDTGLGDVRAGEGVVGLRHAFERAGAATVIMSLWGADDGAARAFMRALYATRSGGATTPEAMRRAALDLLQFQRVHGRTTHPYSWGGFVAAGDWR